MQPRDVVLAWVDAFNRRDVGALAALYAETAVNHESGTNHVRARQTEAPGAHRHGPRLKEMPIAQGRSIEAVRRIRTTPQAVAGRRALGIGFIRALDMSCRGGVN